MKIWLPASHTAQRTIERNFNKHIMNHIKCRKQFILRFQMYYARKILLQKYVLLFLHECCQEGRMHTIDVRNRCQSFPPQCVYVTEEWVQYVID